jgi:hypothetical protein
MTPKIKVSRHNLTRCPACQAHIQLAATLRATVCPFCQTALTSAPPTPPTMLSGLIHGALATGRSGLLAAGLLGLSVSACSEEETNPPADTTSATDATDTNTDTNTDPDTTPADDDMPVAEYGIPPDDTASAPDSTMGDLYGLPPDAVEDADEDVPANDYGLPPTP